MSKVYYDVQVNNRRMAGVAVLVCVGFSAAAVFLFPNTGFGHSFAVFALIFSALGFVTIGIELFKGAVMRLKIHDDCCIQTVPVLWFSQMDDKVNICDIHRIEVSDTAFNVDGANKQTTRLALIKLDGSRVDLQPMLTRQHKDVLAAFISAGYSGPITDVRKFMKEG